MKLMTKEIERLARSQHVRYAASSLGELMVVAKFFDPCGSWTWYLITQDPDDADYLWGIVKGFELEMGSFSLKELKEYKGKFGLGIERDLYFRPMSAKEVWDRLGRGEHI
jgi:hypothetical protein